MARMLPPIVAAGTISQAERVMFGRIRDELSSEWIVLHSLGLTIHSSKPWAEIDFVLIGPSGVFCLEVKGGLISRRDGIWYTTPQYGSKAGQPEKLKESPFEQVGAAAASLFRFIEYAVPGAGRVVTGYAVATPDVVWTIVGPDVDRELVYDQRDSIKPFAEFVDRVVRHWDKRVGSGRSRQLEILGRHVKQAVLERIRGDFQLVPTLRTLADSVEREIVRLTDEQIMLFERLAANPRVIAQGGAGTGKTLIAAEEATRLARQGEKVLLTCFSRNLARRLAGMLREVSGVTVRTLHALMMQIVDQAGRKGDLPDVDEDDLFALFLPELALEVILDDETNCFDVVLVDEAQDVLRGPYLDVIEALVGGDLRNGSWRFFLDPNQNIFGGVAEDALERIRGAGAVDWPLTVNCRNTAPIATQVALLSGTPLAKVIAPDGPAVEIHWYVSADEQRLAVRETLHILRREGIMPDQISVLSRHRLEQSVAIHGFPMPFTDVSRGGIDSRQSDMAFATISSFKGLEAEVVLLVDVDDLSSADGLSSVYVGASRAKVALYVFISDRVRERLNSLAHEFGHAVVN